MARIVQYLLRVENIIGYLVICFYMQDLFTQQESALSPLADRMRPRTLDEFIGQRHIVGPGRLLRRAIEADRMTSSIFYGPPGCGKTTLA